MSAIGNGSEDRPTREDGDERLSTGLENLDDSIKGGGIREGTVATVLSSPASTGDILVANMIAGRPAYYFTNGRSAEHVGNSISDIQNVNMEHVHVKDIDGDNPIQSIRGEIKNANFPRGATIIVNPVNALEKLDLERYKSLLREFNEAVKGCGGVGVLHCVNSQTDPVNRWFSLQFSDTVFEVIHKSSDEMVGDYLAIQKLYPGQTFVDEDARVFELDHELNIDIATSRNISP